MAWRIWVLDAGQVVESGTHDELVARDGTFAALWRVQTGEVGAHTPAWAAPGRGPTKNDP